MARLATIPGTAMYLIQASQPRLTPLNPTVAIFKVESPVRKIMDVAVVATKTDSPSAAASACCILALRMMAPMTAITSSARGKGCGISRLNTSPSP